MQPRKETADAVVASDAEQGGHSGELLALQDIDSEIDAVVHKRRHLPERSRVDADVSRIDSMRSEAATLRCELRNLGERQAAFEAELASSEQRRSAIERRMFSAQTTSTRDLQAMQAEAGSLQAKASDLEDEILALLEATDAAAGRLGELDSSIATAGEALLVAAKELDEAEKTIDAQLSRLRASRVGAKAALPEPLFARYERLRSRLGGVAVSRVVGRRCSGCHLTLSAVELEQVRHAAAGDVYACEQCSRMLVVDRSGE